MLFILPVFAAPLPAQGTNPYYKQLFQDWLNGTIDTRQSGRLIAGLNSSFYDFNVTNNLIVIGNISGEIPNAFKNSNFSTLYNNEAGTRFSISNGSAEYASTGYKSANYSAEYASTGYKIANFTSNLADRLAELFNRGNLSNDLSNGVITSIITDTLQVNKQFIVIGNITNANVTNLNINGSLIPSLDANFDIGNATSRWRNANYSGTVGIGTLSLINRITSSQVDIADIFSKYNTINFTSDYDNKAYYQLSNFTSNYGTEYASTGYKLSNFTTAYDNRADRYSITNYSAEYASTGYKLSNFTSNYDARADRYSITNYSAEYASTGFKISNYSNEYSSTGWKIGNMTGDSLGRALSNKTDINPRYINLSLNISMQTNMSINFLNQSTQSIGYIQFWNDTCFIQRNYVSGSNYTFC